MNPESLQLISEFKNSLKNQENYSVGEIEFILRNLDPLGLPLKNLPPLLLRNMFQTFLNQTKEARDHSLLMLAQNHSVRIYSERMGVKNEVARDSLCEKGLLKISTTLSELDLEQKRLMKLNPPPPDLPLEKAQKSFSYKTWFQEQKILMEKLGADVQHPDGEAGKRKKIQISLSREEKDYLRQMSEIYQRFQKQIQEILA